MGMTRLSFWVEQASSKAARLVAIVYLPSYLSISLVPPLWPRKRKEGPTEKFEVSPVSRKSHAQKRIDNTKAKDPSTVLLVPGHLVLPAHRPIMDACHFHQSLRQRALNRAKEVKQQQKYGPWRRLHPKLVPQ